MRIFGLDIDLTTKKVPNLAGTPIEDQGGRTIEIKKIKPVSNPVLAYRTSFSKRGTFEPPEYNLVEIGRVEDVESYARQAFRKKCGLMFKEGWEFIGPNQKTVTYIQERFMQIEAASGMPTKLLMRETAMNLIKYSNAFWVKTRNQRASGGSPRVLPGQQRRVTPIAAYFQVPPEAIEIKRDEHGKVLRYRQKTPEGKFVEFNPIDVVHFYFDRKTGFATGTPFIVPVLDDIRALRRIEENIELLVYQNLFPLFHYKVGTPEAPAEIYPDGTNEVDVVRKEIQFMPSEGGIVTPERHAIDAIGSEGRAIRAEGYLTHFKKRVFSGLGLSAVDFGEGETANRATADNMSRSLVDDVKAMQRELETFISEYVIKELLLESTFDKPVSLINLVAMKFHEVDLDAKIKVENHMMTLYQGFLTTEDETRRSMGLEPLTEEQRANTFWELVKKPQFLIQSLDESLTQEEAVASPGVEVEEGEQAAANQRRMAEEERMARAKAAGRKGPAKTKSSGAEGTAKSRNQPSNQRGKNQGPTKRKSFHTGGFSLDDNVVKEYYNMLKSDAILAIKKGTYDPTWLKAHSLAAAAKAQEKFERELRTSFRAGVRKAGVSTHLVNSEFAFRVISDRAHQHIGKIINRLMDLLNARVHGQIGELDQKNLISKVSAVFDAVEFRTETVHRSELHKANMFGLALGLRAAGFAEAGIQTNEGACEECINNKDLTIDLNYVTIDQVPGLHPNCTCSLKPIQPNQEEDSIQDLTAKEERCVKRVKSQLRKKFPGRSAENIKVSAIRICRASVGDESTTDELVEKFKEEDFNNA